MPVRIETATLPDLSFFSNQAAREGWNPGLSDLPCFYATDPEGFFIAKEGDTTVGCISAVAYNSAFGFMGFYIVLPEWRHKGIGLKLWEAALLHLPTQTIGLDGVVAQQENYKKSGFQLAYKNMRFEGKKGPAKKRAKSIPAPFEAISAYDKQVFGIDRSLFLNQWFNMPNAHVASLQKDGAVTGYGVIRKCLKGFKIGPLFASDASQAAELFELLVLQAAGQPYYLDIPLHHQEALDLVNHAEMQPVFETARMYRGTPPKQLLEHVFGITSFELG